MAEFKIGTTLEESHVVGDDDVISFLGAGQGRVLSTPRMILFMERACRHLAETGLDAGQATVGIHVNIWHRAAVPWGSLVSYKAELLTATARRLEFRVEARTDNKLIGEGTHLQAIIAVQQFTGG